MTEDAGMLDGVKVVTRCSSVIFLVPLFVPPDTYLSGCRRATELQPRFWDVCGYQWRHLLPHVQKYLYSDHGPGDGTTATLLTTTKETRSWLLGPRESAASWQLQLPNERSIGVRPEAGYLFAFYSGFVMAGLEVKADTDDAGDWFDLLHYGRFLGDRACRLTVTAKDKGQMGAMLAKLAGAAGTEMERSGEDLTVKMDGFAPYLDLFLETAGFSDEAHSVTGGTADIQGDRDQVQAYPVLTFAGEAAADRATHLLNRTSGFHHSGRSSFSFDFDTVSEGVLPYQAASWFLVSAQGGGLVAVYPDGERLTQFQSDDLPKHARTDYLFAFAFGAFQRFTMIRLSYRVVGFSEEVLRARDSPGRGPVRQQADLAQETKTLLDLEARVLEFTSRGLFAQLSQSAHHHRYYRVVQQTNQIAELHRELRDEVEALREFEEAREAARREARSTVIELVLGLVTGIIIPMQLVAALFPDTVSKWPGLRSISPGGQEAGAVVLIVVLAAASGYLFWRAGRRSR